MEEARGPRIAVLGGTGKEGSGLALRWASRGYGVVIGSRSSKRAAENGIRFQGAEQARPSPGFLATLDDPALQAIIVCPSNPWLSIAPLLALPGISGRLRDRRVAAVAVSPFIGGKAVKGPAGKIMAELGLSIGPADLAGHYRGLIDGLVIDRQDTAPDCRLLATDSLMRDEADQARLAREVLAFAPRVRAMK